MHTDPRTVLRRTLGFPDFRPGQEPLVRAVLSGRDALGVLPTGGGKSVCYQVPAHVLPGLTVVVTPLVSLMEDQVGRARAAGLRAAHLSATQPTAERLSVRDAVSNARIDILFLAPERLERRAVRTWLEESGLGLLAIDEAHCISEWGHDFRPAYRRLGRLASATGAPTVALTASATPEVRDDIVASLRLHRPHVEVRSFDRANLHWSVVRADGERSVLRETARLVRFGGSALVYGPTRRRVAAARDYLAAMGIGAEAYHAGLSGAERSAVQERFLGGRTRVVVATNAFGMGIDKADVRTVVHLCLPASLEAYYQEAGRAGRDGQPARCVAFAAPRDRDVLVRFVDGTHPPDRALRSVFRDLRASVGGDGSVELDSLRGGPITRADIEAWRLGDSSGVLGALERCGAVRRIGPYVGTAQRAGGFEHNRLGVRRRLDLSVARRLRKRALARLAAVDSYRRSRTCRRNAVLGYFGEWASRPCTRCDRCGWDYKAGYF